jgi:CIC family chloride channel protein
LHMTVSEDTKRQIFLMTLGGVVGAASGLTAVAFRFLIIGINLVFIPVPNAIGSLGWIIIPAIGGIFTGIIVVRYAPEAKGHGVPEVMESYVLHGGKMRLRVPFLKSVASAITIGTGGSCGREGPIAQIGAGVGSGIADKLGLSKEATQTLVICGVSSGIAATFNAPLGGALFGIEIVAGGILGFSVLPVILSSVVSTAVADISLRLIVGKPLSLSFIAPSFVMQNPIELIFFLLLGLALGLISVLWIRGFYFIEGLFEKIRTSKYFIPILGGLFTGIVGVIGIYFEQIFSYTGLYGDQPYIPAVMGVEYAFIDRIFTYTNILAGGVTLLATLAIFSLLKFFTTSATLGSGGSGGIFAPTLFIGGGLGGALGWIFAFIAPTVINPTGAMVFALVGMASLFGSSARAPITCIVIIMEMTNDYFLILPLMVAVSSAYLVSAVLEPESIYTMKLARRGVHVQRGTHVGALKAVKVGSVMTKDPTILHPTMTTSEVFEVINRTHHTKFPVVDDFGNVIGILIAEDLFHEPKEDGTEYQVRELMNPKFLHLSPSCTMDSALQEMIKRDEGHAVIVSESEPNKMLGYITKADVLKAYEIAIINLQKAGADVEAIDPALIVDVENLD